MNNMLAALVGNLRFVKHYVVDPPDATISRRDAVEAICDADESGLRLAALVHELSKGAPLASC
jgi:hypothetical protein